MTPGETDTRTREILGSPPRLEPLAPGEVSSEAMAIICRMRDLHDIPHEAVPSPTFTTLCHHPALFNAYLTTGLAFSVDGLLPERARELAILRTGWLCRAPYEWGEHLAKAHAAGLTPDDVERITQGSSAPGWSPADRAILRAAEELHANAMVADDTWAALAGEFDPAQLIELLMLIGHYTQTAYIQNTLRFVPRDSNPGLTGR